MATATLSRVCDNTNDVNFRAWAQAISNQFVAFGWTRVVEPGLVDWNTVTRATNGNTVAGITANPAREIFAMNDPLQNTAPVFVAVEYGSGANVLNPSVWIQKGTATNGAGQLAGTTDLRQQFASNGNVNAPHVCKFSGDVNRFACALWPEFNGASNLLAFGIERSHNSDGTDTDESSNALGIVLPVSSCRQIVCPKAGTGVPPAPETRLSAIFSTTNSTVRGARTGLEYITPRLGLAQVPHRNFVLYLNHEVTAGTDELCQIYNGISQRLYFIGGTTGGFSAGGLTDAQSSRVAMRWD